jgi:hypothetical protein
MKGGKGKRGRRRRRRFLDFVLTQANRNPFSCFGRQHALAICPMCSDHRSVGKPPAAVVWHMPRSLAAALCGFVFFFFFFF